MKRGLFLADIIVQVGDADGPEYAIGKAHQELRQEEQRRGHKRTIGHQSRAVLGAIFREKVTCVAQLEF